ncbi:hypothetical protein FJTKL_07897 [Diaporthe vaccinii]|uniref:Uncharacterized protein n=1 Tax=Diaporthe vaccinii TaxID=105482 RepID=A0ABR4FEB4_9PEZI
MDLIQGDVGSHNVQGLCGHSANGGPCPCSQFSIAHDNHQLVSSSSLVISSIVVSRYQSHIFKGIHMYSFKGVQPVAYFFPASHHPRPPCSVP